MPDALAVARALISTAPPEALRAALLALLNDAPAPARPPVTAKARTVPTRAPPAPTPPHRKRPAARSRRPTDAAWEALRQRVRTAMRERGMDWAQLGAAIGRSGSHTKSALYRRDAPGSGLRAKLQAWLDADGTAAPAVASPAAPFRGGRAKPRANGTATTADT